jgi:hypothetical protein
MVSDEKTPPVDHWQMHCVKQMHGIDGHTTISPSGTSQRRRRRPLK